MAAANLKIFYRQFNEAKKDSLRDKEFDINLYEGKIYIRFTIKTGFWKGQTHVLELAPTPDYPFKPPVCKFLTKIYHSNVGHLGSICVDVLRSDKWQPAFNMSVFVTQVIMFINQPEVDMGHMFPEASTCYRNCLIEWEREKKNIKETNEEKLEVLRDKYFKTFIEAANKYWGESHKRCDIYFIEDAIIEPEPEKPTLEPVAPKQRWKRS